MKNTKILIGMAFLTLLVGCQDVSSNRRQGTNNNTVITRPGAEGTDGSDSIRSSMHRERGAPVLSYADEIKKTLANDLPETLYRTVPLMEKDDEGSIKNVITVDRRGRPTTACGLGNSFAGIDARVTDCFQKNGDNSIWEGATYGAAGEGTWKLVQRNNDGDEIWIDGRTGMVWSDIAKNSTGINVFNWCKASGNTQNDTPTESIDCNAISDGINVCEIVSDEISSQIKWRLPTRNDFLQADLNGSRFVLKKETEVGLWTATMRAGVSGRTEAWVYNSKDGTLSPGTLTTERQVRCIGAPVR